MGARRSRERQAARRGRLAEHWLARTSVRVTLAGIAVGIIGIVVGILTLANGAGSPASRDLVRPGRARLQLLPRSHNAVVPKGIADLPVPPRYPTSARQDHCGSWWRGWLDELHAAEASSVPTIAISAPVRAPVTVTAARVRVFRTYLPKAVSYVMCLYGAGPSPGTLLGTDLTRPNARPTIVADDGREEPLAMPNAVITVGRGQTEYVAVTPKGQPRMYEWAVSLSLVVDQQPQTVSFGSAQHPLRSWLGRMPSKSYDFDFQARAWKAGT